MHTNSRQSGAEPLPVAIIGAGPIGLVAAAHLVTRGERPLILEAGAAVGASIRAWSHVRLFSPWKYLTDPVSRRLLQETGWFPPDDDRLPTGGELVERFLEPLAAHPEIAPHLLLGRRVEAISRRGYDKVKTAGREEAPFELVVRTASGEAERYLARAVIDASGTYTTPNPLGASGLPLDGEVEFGERISYGIPDVLGHERARFAGRRSIVIGSGHSAFNAVLDLARLGEEEPGTEVVWAVRRREPGLMFGGGGADALEARGTLGSRLRELVDSGAVEFTLGFRAERVTANGRGVLIEGEGGRVIGPVDEIVVTTGYRPDLGILRELRVGLDPWLEAPTALAPLIDPNLHSCGTVYPHGYEELEHPERDFFVVGMKSYGRAPTFLLLTGYEQVRSVVAGLTGDLEGARAVELVLPETGVCSTDLVSVTNGADTEERAGAGAACGTGTCFGAAPQDSATPAQGAAIIQLGPLAGTCCAPAAAPLAIISATPGRSCCG
jgi:thioredoxin reductase